MSLWCILFGHDDEPIWRYRLNEGPGVWKGVYTYQVIAEKCKRCLRIQIR
jgi:hypothetical protein